MTQAGLVKGKKPMPTTEKTLRVLVVDDDRDGADSLGLLVEELGNQVHVTYGGMKALEVATAFRPDLMLVDLVMPEMDGCGLVTRFRQFPAFAQTRIVAITGQKDEERKVSALKAGCDAVLFKPATLTAIEAVLASVAPPAQPGAPADQSPRLPQRASVGATRRLPIGEARRIRNERKSKALTQTESEAAICEGIIRFQEEYLGHTAGGFTPTSSRDNMVVRLLGVLTLAERQLALTLRCATLA